MNNVSLVSLYINGEVFMYPEQIYNSEELSLDNIEKFNLYFICNINKLRVINIDNSTYTIEIWDENKGKSYLIKITELDFFKECKLIIESIEKCENDKYINIKFEQNDTLVKIPTYDLIMYNGLNDNIQDEFDFEVLYIGQSKGRIQKRNAIDRLKNHKTLQKIMITNDDNKDKIICLFSCSNKVYSEYESLTFNMPPLALTKEQTIDIVESGLINYFKPKYNEVFKSGNFPQSKLKTHKSLYTNSYLAVIMEIDFQNYSINFKGHHTLSRQDRFIHAKWLKEFNGDSFFVKDIVEIFSDKE
ncbi:hypothetical protein K4R20_03790 [Staphylococcus epidermidis]|uniref:hypothetical protein n=1 Tax=Staphylococcus epidermidis TaxID=1282 RepID=UPI00285D738E|nr:hypothetical protein [Staphylococcus epidermidis]MCG1061594.1 hypothetical protein [Staphylococcus epidermidis]MCG2096478.1 hypothetical protein [Staphylococcus epidermidis]MCG2217248.1 hypothetical protein [Staphylococcus epidermidis]MDR6745684.1 hypothetical protein [Staphylococcus epidermidis]